MKTRIDADYLNSWKAELTEWIKNAYGPTASEAWNAALTSVLAGLAKEGEGRVCDCQTHPGDAPGCPTHDPAPQPGEGEKA